ncbi:hypothetical protein ACFVHB_10180 [Kitasatospora sp. NPDC127111]|uniref:hypothetical protein n=1 Tax=Kitasatospora sp. NPDC127111 TaxID=3345363 RepID=UPI003640DD8D
MTGEVAPPQADALEPVRAELLRAARAEAEALRVEARRKAEEIVAGARAEAEAVLDRARRHGEADGRAAAAGEVARARRAARTTELTAQGEAYAELRHRATERVRELYEADSAVAAGLIERARGCLGAEARITAHPEGGLLATVPGRLIDFGLPTLVQRALDRLGAEAETLWCPGPGESGG